MPFPPLVEPVAALSDDERARTARHARLGGLGEEGQRRIAAAHVAVMGAGGLGSPVILALAAAGVGTLRVIDDDVVELTNLQRQILHRRADVGQPKTDSATRVAADLSETRIIPVRTRLTAENAAELLAGADLVIDGTDTFETREAVAAGCQQLGIPLVWGTLQEFAGQVTVFWSDPPAPAAPVVLNDLYPPGSEAPSCAAVGVLGTLCMQVGSILATEAIKLITGIGEPLLGRMLLIDAWRATQREIPLRTATATAPAAMGQNRGMSEISGIPQVDVSNLPDDAVLLDVREPNEFEAGHAPGAVSIPLGEVRARAAEVSSAGGTVHVICRGGGRSQKAAEFLASQGVQTANVTGGTTAWAQAGKPLVNAAGAPGAVVDATTRPPAEV